MQTPSDATQPIKNTFFWQGESETQRNDEARENNMNAEGDVATIEYNGNHHNFVTQEDEDPQQTLLSKSQQ